MGAIRWVTCVCVLLGACGDNLRAASGDDAARADAAVDAGGDAGTDAAWSTPGQESTRGGDAALIVPVLVPSALDPAALLALPFREQVEFLYTGPDPVQVGVAPGTIVAQRLAVLRGLVRFGDGAPAPGATVTVVDHPEFGATHTRADGAFDLAVNGGGPLTLLIARPGSPSVRRTAIAPWQDFARVDDVVLVRFDAMATAIAVDAAVVQIATSAPSTDGDGTRRARAVFAPGTHATAVLPDGSEVALGSLAVRLTEYTVGATGPAAMPAPLPPTSAYTYCVEASADEAIALGAATVTFDRPVALVVDNFLAIPVGTVVPSGTFDAARGRWVADPDGVVIGVVAAGLDSDGDGAADSAAALLARGIDADEAAALRAQFAPGQSFWRAAITHFSPHDLNFYARNNLPRPPPDLPLPPNPATPTSPKGGAGDGLGTIYVKSCYPNCGPEHGSVIRTEHQALGEDVDLVGVPFQLHHESTRAPGRVDAYQLEVPLIGATPTAAVTSIDVEVTIAGQRIHRRYEAAELVAGLRFRHTWDGRDGYGRVVNGARTATIAVAYNLPVDYWLTTTSSGATFGDPAPADATAVAGRGTAAMPQRFTGVVGTWRASGEALGGWTVASHHHLDLIAGVLHLGSGEQRADVRVRERRPRVITRLAGVTTPTGDPGALGDGGPASQAEVTAADLVVTPDGSVIVADDLHHRLRRIGPDGIITTVAGTGAIASGGDGGPAIAAALFAPWRLALAPDGSIYVETRSLPPLPGGGGGIPATVRRISPDGIISTMPTLDLPVFAADGSSYYTTGQMITRRSLGGEVFRVAGTGDPGLSGDGPALTRDLWAFAPTPTADGGVLFASVVGAVPPGGTLNAIRKLTADGAVITIAGNPLASGNSGDLLPATDAGITITDGRVIAPGPDRSIDIATTAGTIRRVWADGTISTIAGNGQAGYDGDGGPAELASIQPTAIAVGPDGTLYLGDAYGVRQIAPLPPPSEYAVASADGDALYVFDAQLRHLRTVDARTGGVTTSFTYAGERLTGVTDGYGNATVIERDGAGLATAIVGPDGQRTTLTLDATGALTAIDEPGSAHTGFGYDSGGLLTTLTEPDGRIHRFGYDADGRLIRDEDGAGHAKQLAFASIAEGGYRVTTTTATGDARSQELRFGADRSAERVLTAADGAITRVAVASDGLPSARASATVTTGPDGTVVTTRAAPDPLFGIDAAYPTREQISRPSGQGYTLATQVSRTLVVPDDLTGGSDWLQTTAVGGDTFSESFASAIRTSTVTSPLGRVSRVVVDAHGNPLVLTAPQVDPIVLTRDARGRIARLEQGARATDLTYGGDGQVATMTSAGRTWAYGWDARLHLVAATRPSGARVDYGRDVVGRLVSVTPPGRPAHALTWTASDHLASYTPPDVGGHDPVSFTYDDDDRPSARLRADGRMVAFTYDRGRLATISHDGTTGAFAYTADGRVASFTEGATTAAPTYDGGLITGVVWTGAVNGAIAATFDDHLRAASVSTAGVTIPYAYDADDLLLTAGGLTYARDPASGRVTGTTLGRVDDSVAYDAAGLIASRTTRVDAAPVFIEQVTRDAAMRIATRTETTAAGTVVTAYTYDADGRLTQVTADGVGVLTAAWDANGNRTAITDDRGAQSATFDARDRLLGQGAAVFSHTVDGEVASVTTGAAVTTYVHDALGNLTQVVMPGVTVAYASSSVGGRLTRAVDGVVVERYLWDPDGDLVATFDSAGALTRVFVYGEGRAPIAMIAGQRSYRVVTDHLGSIRFVVDSTDGTIAQERAYDAFGRVTRDTNPGFQPLGFAGGFTDALTGLVHLGAREYDPGAGRFLERDPLLFGADSTNLYAYAEGDPINRIDPSGLAPDEDAWSTVGGANGLLGTVFGVASVVQFLESPAVDAAGTAVRTGTLKAWPACVAGFGPGFWIASQAYGAANAGYTVGSLADYGLRRYYGGKQAGEVWMDRWKRSGVEAGMAAGMKRDLALNVRMLTERRVKANPSMRGSMKGLR